LKRIDTRLSDRVLKHEAASDYIPLAKVQITGIEEDFLSFMPDLIAHFKSTSGIPLEGHWLK
jgi:hypothetical protein